VSFSIRDKYFLASTVTLVFYDYALTFEDEVGGATVGRCALVYRFDSRYDMLGKDEKLGVSVSGSTLELPFSPRPSTVFYLFILVRGRFEFQKSSLTWTRIGIFRWCTKYG